jgi:magnesium-transporting ATPase (P-type)
MDSGYPPQATADPTEAQLQSQLPNTVDPEQEARQRRMVIVGVIFGVVVLVGFIVFMVFLLTRNTVQAAHIRDIFIIFMAAESILIGVALVILIIQLAVLINLIQNEIKPILDSTNQTVNNLRGTTAFLSDNLVGPVIKLNEYMAGFAQFFTTIGFFRKKPKK